MKKIFSFIIGILLVASQVYATVVKITPEVIDLTTVGNTFQVNVEIEDVTDLQGFQFEITYDPNIVTASKVVAGNFLTGTLLGLGPTITSGKVTYGAISLSSGSTGSGILAPITFTKKNESYSNQPIHFNEVMLFDSDVNQLSSESRDGYLTIYHITADSGPNGNISPSGDVPAAYNRNQEFIITPNEGYQIESLTIDGSQEDIVNYYTFENVTQNHTIHAEFTVKNTCTIEASAGTGGSISPSGTVVVNCGEDKMFTITPDPGYNITDVKIDGNSVGSANSYTFNSVNKDHTIIAYFAAEPAPENHIIEANAGSGGNISPSGNVIVDHGASRIFTITPNSCYRILDVKVDGISAGAVNSYTINNITANHTIEATFEKVKYTISSVAGLGGNISPSGNVNVECGANQTFTITPNQCYRILDVKVDVISAGAVNSYTINNITANHTIEATFEKVKYTISSVAGPGGSISPSGNIAVECGASQIFTITPNQCYRILDVKVNGASQGAITSYTFNNITSDQKIEVAFEKEKYLMEVVGSCGITPSGNLFAECGTTQTYLINLDICYHISDVKVDGVSVGVVSSYTFNNINTNHRIEAICEKDKYVIESTAGDGGSISPSGNITKDCSENQIFTITPSSPCYHILDVKVDEVSQGAITAYTFSNISVNHKISAVFEKNRNTVTFVSSEGGSISGKTIQQIECDTCTEEITAVPNKYYYFTRWSGDYNGTENPMKLCNVTKDMTITANFEKVEYTVQFDPGIGGKINGNSVQKVKHGECAEEVSAVSDDCYEFTGWSVDYTGKENPLKLCNVTADMKITANFAKKRYNVSFISGHGGTISGKTVQIVECGECAETVIPVPDDCYEFTVWIGDYIGKDNPLNLCNITEDMIIRANFAVKEFEVKFIGIGNGCLEGETVQKVKCGENTTQITAVPGKNYHFADWSGDYPEKDKYPNPMTYGPVTNDLVIVANFETENLPAASLYPEMICLAEDKEKFDVTVNIENVTEIGSFQFNILYDPLSVMIEDEKNVKLNNLLNSDNETEAYTVAVNNLAGKLTVSADVVHEGELPDGDFPLATITFTVISQNKGVLDLNQVQLSNRCGSDLITEKTDDAEIGIETPPVVTTYDAANIDSSSVYLSGNVISENCTEIVVKGICWSTDEYPTAECSMGNAICGASTDGAGAGKIQRSLKGLEHATTYYFRVYATTYSGDTEYGEQKSFTTLPVLPQVTTDIPNDITLTSAVTGGNVVSDGGDSIIARGICWSISENPSLECEECWFTEDGTGTGTFRSFMTELHPHTVYYIRAYAKNSFGTGYGLVRSFETAECSYPKVSTSEIISVIADKACIKGEVISDCGIQVTARGICWNTKGTPQIEANDRIIKNGSGKGSFTCCIEDLKPGKKYYARAYAINKLGKTAYGTELSFTTPVALSVTTNPITDITDISAESGGNVISDGGYPIKEQGICWGPMQNPVISCSSWNSRCGKIVSDITGIGIYSILITDLEPDTGYYVRAYVISDKGIVYGNQEFLKTAND